MATASATLHLRDADKPVAQRLESGSVALWLTELHVGPTVIGTPEQLLEIRRAIGRFLFPEEVEQPEAAEVEA